MKKTLSVLLALMMGASVLAGCSSSTSSSTSSDAESTTETTPDKVYEIKLVTGNSSTSPTVVLFYEYAERIKELTDGAVEIQVYPGGEILMGDEGIEAIMSDAAVISFNDVDVMSDYVPELATLCASFLVDSHETIEALSKTDIYAEIMEISDAANVHIITSDFSMGARSIFSSVEVYSVEDASELNIRVPNVASYVNAFDAFGANFSAIDWADGLSACETGMLNGVEVAVTNAVSNALYEIIDDAVYSLVQWRNAPVGMIVGNGYWETIPEEYRDIITEQLTACAAESNDIIAANEADEIALLEAEGVKIIPYEDIDIDSFKAAVLPLNESMPLFAEVSAAAEEIMAAN